MPKNSERDPADLKESNKDRSPNDKNSGMPPQQSEKGKKEDHSRKDNLSAPLQTQNQEEVVSVPTVLMESSGKENAVGSFSFQNDHATDLQCQSGPVLNSVQDSQVLHAGFHLENSATGNTFPKHHINNQGVEPDLAAASVQQNYLHDLPKEIAGASKGLTEDIMQPPADCSLDRVDKCGVAQLEATAGSELSSQSYYQLNRQ
ncbi:unnamed protein product [Ilex paraguariensis]